MTIKDYYSEIATTVLTDKTITYFINYDFFKKYYHDIDNYIKYHFDDYRLLRRIEQSDTVADDVQQRVYYCLLANLYKLNGLYETTQFEYNPLWNVDGTTVTTTDSSTDDTNARTNGGTRKNDLNVNENNVRDSNKNESVSNTAEVGETLYLREKSVVDDTATDNNNRTENATETLNLTQNDDRDIVVHSVVTEQKKGNIGVTKTTELIADQRTILDFNFLQLLCHTIVNCITTGVF